MSVVCNEYCCLYSALMTVSTVVKQTATVEQTCLLIFLSV